MLRIGDRVMRIRCPLRGSDALLGQALKPQAPSEIDPLLGQSPYVPSTSNLRFRYIGV